MIKVTDGPGSLEYTYDKLARIIKETRVIDSNLYTTEYEYDFQGNIKKIKYPDSDEWVSYEYNSLNQLIGLSHAVSNFKYDPAGNLIEMAYSNGVTTLITPEVMGRTEKIDVKDSTGKSLLDLNYAYDENGNVIRRNNNIYTYDQLDRLKTAEIDGTILVDRPARKGYIDNDYFINRGLNYEVEDMEVEFDYAASTFGIKFDICQDIGRIELLPDGNLEHRISKSSIRIFYRTISGGNFVELSENDWVYDQDTAGKVIITFKKIIEAVEIKIHSNFDDRDIKTGEVINRAEFSNLLEEMVRVYGRYNRTKISYEYDEVGNRISETYTDPDFDYSVTYNYDYYSNSNRLKVRESEKVENIVPFNGSYVDGLFRVGPAEKRAYRYDKAGNLIEKGNKYSISGDGIDFSEISGNDALYWKYEYNAKNRLTEVFKDGESEENRIARYGYDFSGKRLKVEEGGKVTYYVYNYFGQLIYEDGEKDMSYIYALGKVVAKVEGSIGSGEEKYCYYHHDNLGSTRLITDEAGKVVFEQDYSPFGRDLYKPGRYEKPDNLEAGFKYTGQIADVNTGLYYYNARYYDVEVGRFTREDDYQGDIFAPQTLNLYVYTVNNPLKYVDPSGHCGGEAEGRALAYGYLSFKKEHPNVSFGEYLELKGALNSSGHFTLEDLDLIVDLGLMLVGADTFKDIPEAILGKSLVSGEKYSTVQRILIILPIVSGTVVKQGGKLIVKNVDKADEVIEIINKHGGEVAEKAVKSSDDVKLLTGDATGYLNDGIVGAEYGGVNIGDLGSIASKGIDEANFASIEKLISHFEKHGSEFKGVYKNADEYLQGARDVMKNGIKISYTYKGETRIGFVRFMGNDSKGVAKFEFVGTNNAGQITTYHVESGKTFWKMLNGENLNAINPLD